MEFSKKQKTAAEGRMIVKQEELNFLNHAHRCIGMDSYATIVKTLRSDKWLEYLLTNFE